MTRSPQPTHQDDLARLLGILSDAPAGGLSLEEIHEATKAGEVWSFRTINSLLCDLGRQVDHEKIRVKHQKVVKYFLRKAS